MKQEGIEKQLAMLKAEQEALICLMNSGTHFLDERKRFIEVSIKIRELKYELGRTAEERQLEALHSFYNRSKKKWWEVWK